MAENEDADPGKRLAVIGSDELLAFIRSQESTSNLLGFAFQVAEYAIDRSGIQAVEVDDVRTNGVRLSPVLRAPQSQIEPNRARMLTQLQSRITQLADESLRAQRWVEEIDDPDIKAARRKVHFEIMAKALAAKSLLSVFENLDAKKAAIDAAFYSIVAFSEDHDARGHVRRDIEDIAKKWR